MGVWGGEAQERGDMHTGIADAYCPTAEANPTL